MARTHSTAVQELLGPGYCSTTPCGDMERYIRHATNMIDRMVTCATSKGFTHTTAELFDLETLLAAHYYTIGDPLYVSRSTGAASGSFQPRSYKEEAWEADASGCLRSLAKGGRAEIVWLGKKPSTQIDYVDRD